LRHFPVVDGQPLDFYRLHEVRVGLRGSSLRCPYQRLPSPRSGSRPLS
jgi:pyruvate-formate lyase-activating enzyme